MTAKEAAKMRRLEVENEELKTLLSKQCAVYRDQLFELADLKTRLRLIGEAMRPPEQVQ